MPGGRGPQHGLAEQDYDKFVSRKWTICNQCYYYLLDLEVTVTHFFFTVHDYMTIERSRDSGRAKGARRMYWGIYELNQLTWSKMDNL